MNFIVFNILRDFLALHLMQPFYLRNLLLTIAGIFDLNFHLLLHLVIQIIRRSTSAFILRISDLWSSEQSYSIYGIVQLNRPGISKHLLNFRFRANLRLLQPLKLLFHHLLLLEKTLVTLLRDEANLIADRRQAEIRIVMTQKQTVFRTRSKQTIRFFRSFGHQIINEHADISV